MIKIWEEAKRLGVSLDTENYQAVIYRGIKVINFDGFIRIYSTETDFYEDITDTFNDETFKVFVNRNLKNKYLKKLDKIENLIKMEMNNYKNHKKFSYLKKMRNEYLKKYNEINTKEITRG